MIKLVAFDLDGTIGDTIPMCLKALKKAVTPYVGFSGRFLHLLSVRKGDEKVPVSASFLDRGRFWAIRLIC